MKNNETNMEHYRGEILESLKLGILGFAMKKDGGILNCQDIDCEDCLFSSNEADYSCGKNRILWLMEEYKELPVLTADEKHFVEFAETGFIARDAGEELYYYFEKPFKNGDHWTPPPTHADCIDLDMFERELFSFITWEDEEPWSVKELRKLEVKDE